MKAVILLAGVGSRLHPLTLDRPKSLLPIGETTTLQHMISKLQRAGIRSFVIVCGHMQDTIQAYVAEAFPGIDVAYVTNDLYLSTNTGYSLLKARELIGDDSFIKLDGDVIFDEAIITKLIGGAQPSSYVCIDNTAVDDEVIKVILGSDGNISHIGNKLSVAESVGESIGIELIANTDSDQLFRCLAEMMKQESQQQNYYEVAYEEIIQQGVVFRTIDITGLDWVEMDTLADYRLAQSKFDKVIS